MNTNVGSDHAGDNVSDLSISLFLGRLVIGLGLINYALKVNHIKMKRPRSDGFTKI